MKVTCGAWWISCTNHTLPYKHGWWTHERCLHQPHLSLSIWRCTKTEPDDQPHLTIQTCSVSPTTRACMPTKPISHTLPYQRSACLCMHIAHGTVEHIIGVFRVWLSIRSHLTIFTYLCVHIWPHLTTLPNNANPGTKLSGVQTERTRPERHRRTNLLYY